MSSSHWDHAFIITYVIFMKRCKRMVNVVLKCEKANYVQGAMMMVENHTAITEAYERG